MHVEHYHFFKRLIVTLPKNQTVHVMHVEYFHLPPPLFFQGLIETLPKKHTVHVMHVEGFYHDPAVVDRDGPSNFLFFFKPIEGSACENHWATET